MRVVSVMSLLAGLAMIHVSAQTQSAPGAPQSGQPAGQAAAPPAAGRGGRGGQPGLDPRIVSFEAQPTTVRLCEPVLLVWHTENPGGGVTIEPEIGAVVPRGSRQVRPSATTTFTPAMA